MASSYQFDFGDTPNISSGNDPIEKDHHTYNDGDTTMILTNIFNRDKVSTVDIIKVLCNPNLHSTQGIKEITIDGRL